MSVTSKRAKVNSRSESSCQTVNTESQKSGSSNNDKMTTEAEVAQLRADLAALQAAKADVDADNERMKQRLKDEPRPTQYASKFLPKFFDAQKDDPQHFLDQLHAFFQNGKTNG